MNNESITERRAKCEIFRFCPARRCSTRVGVKNPGRECQETNVFEDVSTIQSQNTKSPKNLLPPAIPSELTDLTKDVYNAIRYTADLLLKFYPDRALQAFPRGTTRLAGNRKDGLIVFCEWMRYEPATRCLAHSSGEVEIRFESFVW